MDIRIGMYQYFSIGKAPIAVRFEPVPGRFAVRPIAEPVRIGE